MASIVPDRNRNDLHRTTPGHIPPRSSNIKMGPRPGGPSNLVAEKRMDINGRLVTRHVRGDAGDHSPSAALVSQTAARADTPNSLPSNVDWDASSTKQVGKMIATLADDIDNPDRVWENFDLCTSLLDSKYGASTYYIVSSMKDKLPIAWAAKHGVEFGSQQAYDVEGDEGFKALYETRDALNTAAYHALQRRQRCSAEQVAANTLATQEIADALAAVRNPQPEPVAPEPKHSFFERIKEAREDGDIMAPFSEKFDDITDVVSSGFDSVAERHTGDIPEGVEGTTVSWSDLNPFKGWGKKKG